MAGLILDEEVGEFSSTATSDDGEPMFMFAMKYAAIEYVMANGTKNWPISSHTLREHRTTRRKRCAHFFSNPSLDWPTSLRKQVELGQRIHRLDCFMHRTIRRGVNAPVANGSLMLELERQSGPQMISNKCKRLAVQEGA